MKLKNRMTDKVASVCKTRMINRFSGSEKCGATKLSPKYKGLVFLALAILFGCENNGAEEAGDLPLVAPVAIPNAIKINSLTPEEQFIFTPDEGVRSDKIIGKLEFTLTEVDTGKYIRDLSPDNMTYVEKEYGSQGAYSEEVEATQSSAIEKTYIDVIYLIDTSYSVVEANADEEIIYQANSLAKNINKSDGLVSTTTRFRTFADTVGSLRTSYSDQPFDNLKFEEKGGGTALYEAIYTSLLNLSNSAQPLLFVFTDGRENASARGYSLDLVVEASKLYDVPIYIVSLESVDSDALKKIASESKGKYFHAENVGELPKVFEDTLNAIPVTYTAIYRPTQRTGHVEFKFVVNYYGVQDSIADDFDVDMIFDN